MRPCPSAIIDARTAERPDSRKTWLRNRLYFWCLTLVEGLFSMARACVMRFCCDGRSLPSFWNMPAVPKTFCALASALDMVGKVEEGGRSGGRSGGRNRGRNRGRSLVLIVVGRVRGISFYPVLS